MTKRDPAFSFFPDDWLGGVMTFSRLQRGAYIDLLVLNWQCKKAGGFTLDEAKDLLGDDYQACWPKVGRKFKKSSDGLYFNERLMSEVEKRQQYSQSRRANRSRPNKSHMSNICGSGETHMGIGNGNSSSIGESQERGAPEGDLYAAFRRAYPNNGTAIGPEAEREFDKSAQAFNPETIIARAREYADYWRFRLGDDYPHGKYVAAAPNWLRKGQYTVSWAAKLIVEKNERAKQLSSSQGPQNGSSSPTRSTYKPVNLSPEEKAGPDEVSSILKDTLPKGLRGAISNGSK